MSEHEIELTTTQDEAGRVVSVSVRFGPHFTTEVRRGDGESTSFSVLYSHHGFMADASTPDAELERIIDEVRSTHPDAAVD